MLCPQEIQYQIRDVEHKIKELFEGYAGEVKLPDPEGHVTYFGLTSDPHEMPETVSRTFEWAHFLPRGSGETPEKAFQAFADQVHQTMPWPSLKPRFHICWRRMPQIKYEEAFDRMRSKWRITARYSLVLDYEPFEKK